MKTPINKDSLRTHWTYSWWKYALIVVLVWAGFSLFYTVTAPQPAPEKVVNMFVFGVAEEPQLDAYMEAIRQNEMADMEEMEAIIMPVDDTYTAMQLTTYIAAGEGDIYVLPKDYFQSYAAQGAFIPLETQPALMDAMAAHGLTTDRGWHTDEESGERRMFGVPVNQLPVFKAQLYNMEDMYVCISVNSGNEDNCVKFVTLLIRDSVAQVEDAPAQ